MGPTIITAVGTRGVDRSNVGIENNMPDELVEEFMRTRRFGSDRGKSTRRRSWFGYIYYVFMIPTYIRETMISSSKVE